MTDYLLFYVHFSNIQGDGSEYTRGRFCCFLSKAIEELSIRKIARIIGLNFNVSLKLGYDQNRPFVSVR